VHLRTADVLLPHQQLVLVLHAFVARARGDVVAVEVDQWHGARRDHAQPERLGHRLQRAAQATQVAAQLVEGGAHRGVGLDERTLELGGELGAVELGQQRVDLGGRAAGLQVDDVELLLHAEARELAHDAERYASDVTAVSPPPR
jgi:hypothetical protein